MNTLKIGLAGFGTGGRFFHAPLIASTQGFQLTAIHTRSESNRAHAKRHFPEVALVDEYADLLANTELDVIVLSIPNHLHFPQAAQALQAGKNVVVDKPFTVTSDEAKQLIGLAKEVKKTLTVFHNRRLDGGYFTLLEYFDKKTLGEIVQFEARFDRYRKELRPNSWKEKPMPGSGILYDLGSHLIDQSLQLFGLPENLFARLNSQRPGAETIDDFEIFLNYKSGLNVRLGANMLSRTPGFAYRAVGLEATLEIGGTDGQEEVLRKGILPSSTESWSEQLNPQHACFYTIKDSNIEAVSVDCHVGNYLAFYQNLHRHLTENEALMVKAEEAIQVVQLIELAIESNRQQHSLVVKI
ncbi:MAG: oxidoreductase [Bacteroidetes bacterium HGW-Bacteroidetes-13]|nr:MAG: oxidoreductase [Bacteroidetes bacterium HGW-Bacteroidetes-13]